MDDNLFDRVDLFKQWDWRNSNFIDRDIKEELSNGGGLFLGDIIHLQIIKELKKLNDQLESNPSRHTPGL